MLAGKNAEVTEDFVSGRTDGDAEQIKTHIIPGAGKLPYGYLFLFYMQADKNKADIDLLCGESHPKYAAKKTGRWANILYAIRAPAMWFIKSALFFCILIPKNSAKTRSLVYRGD